jgi:FkbM family methyltransferase
MTTYFHKFLNFILKIILKLQGKGYGAYSYEHEVKFALSFFRGKSNPLLVIDIGGNKGLYTKSLLAQYSEKDLKIHIFEPSRTNLDFLAKQNFPSNVMVLPYAVSDSAGEALLHSNLPGSGLGSLSKRRLDHFSIDFDCSETVKVIKFHDYWISDLNKSTIDIVKIDIEGYELSALRGFEDAINSIKVIQFEFGGCNIDTRTFFQDFWYFFVDKKFVLYRVTPFGLQLIERYRESDEVFLTTNFIAINSNNLE